MLSRVIVLLGIHAMGHVGHHHRYNAAKEHAALLHVVQRTARLANGTEMEMSRCTSALASAQFGLNEVREQMKERRDQMGHIQQGLQANDASINETARLEAVLNSHLSEAEAKMMQQSTKAEKLQISISAFTRRVEEDRAKLAQTKQSLFDRLAKVKKDRDDLQHAEKDAEVTRLALQRMHNWKHISQDRVGWEEEKLEAEQRNHKRLRQAIAIEIGEVKKDLLAIEHKVQCWDAKRFLLAELLAKLDSTKKEIGKKREMANEDKARLHDVSKLLERRARERVKQMEQLKHAQDAYHDSLEAVVKAQEEQLSEDRATIASARINIKRLRASEAAKANALEDAQQMHEHLSQERDVAQTLATDYQAQLVDSEQRSEEMLRKRDEMLSRLEKQREKQVMKKDQEISELVGKLNHEAAARDAEVAKLEGSLDSLRPAYESRGDAIKVYENIMTSQKKELKNVQNLYDSTKSDLEQCLTSANHVDSAEAKQVLEAVENSIAGQGGEGPLAEIAGAIKDATEQALGSQSSNPDATQETLQNLKDSVSGSSSSTATDGSIPSHWDNEPEALAADFKKLMSKLRKSARPEATPRPLEDKLTESWDHVAKSRFVKEKSVELPDALGEKVRALASELHDVHFGMAGLAGALDEIANL